MKKEIFASQWWSNGGERQHSSIQKYHDITELQDAQESYLSSSTWYVGESYEEVRKKELIGENLNNIN